MLSKLLSSPKDPYSDLHVYTDAPPKNLDEFPIQTWTDRYPKPIRILSEFFDESLVIGYGHSCKVFKGYMFTSEKTIKVVALRAEKLCEFSDPDPVAFERSSVVWPTLDHPHIVKCFGTATAPYGAICQVLEYLPDQADIKPSERREYVELVQAYLGTKNLRHDDLHPDKIEHFRQTNDGTVKVIDLDIMPNTGKANADGL